MTDPPTESGQYSRARRHTKRATKRFRAGEHRFLVTIDHIAKRRMMQLLRAVGLWYLYDDPHRVPGEEAAQLVRMMLTDYWDWMIRTRVERNRPQDVVGELEGNEGAGDDGYALKTIVRVYVILAEIIRGFVGPAALHRVAEETAEVCAEILADGVRWEDVRRVGEVAEELGKLQTAVYIIGDRLAVDTTAEALRYGEDRSISLEDGVDEGVCGGGGVACGAGDGRSDATGDRKASAGESTPDGSAEDDRRAPGCCEVSG